MRDPRGIRQPASTDRRGFDTQLQVIDQAATGTMNVQLLAFSTYPTLCTDPIEVPFDSATNTWIAPEIVLGDQCNFATLLATNSGSSTAEPDWIITFDEPEVTLADRRSGDVQDGVSVSGDGRFMAAVVYGDPDPSVEDILVVDTSNGSEVRISGLNSLSESGEIEFPKITADGARVVAPINEQDGGFGTRRVVWWDRVGADFVGPSQVPAPNPAQPNSLPSISDDGNRIAFYTRDAASDGMMAVYQVDTGTTTLIDLSSIGLTADGEIRPGYISGDGNTVVFPARADVFQPPWQIYAYNLVDNTYIIVSVDDAGAPGSEDALFLDHMSPVTDDGRFVAFNRAGGVYLADRDPDGNGVLDDTPVEVRQLPAIDVFAQELSGNGSYLGYITFAEDQIRRVDITNNQDLLIEADTNDSPHYAAVDDQGRVYYTICDWNQAFPWPCTVYRLP